jgi:hypothetical protein
LRCEDGADNDCDGLTDIRDTDCQSPEICDKKDNNGNGQVDENFPLLGRPCTAGLGECRRDGFFDCTSDGTGVRCSAPPGQRRPEGIGCRCSDGLDNDCDGLIDEDDPDCGGSAMRVRADAKYGDPMAPDPACYLTDEEIGGTERDREEMKADGDYYHHHYCDYYDNYNNTDSHYQHHKYQYNNDNVQYHNNDHPNTRRNAGTVIRRGTRVCL